MGSSPKKELGLCERVAVLAVIPAKERGAKSKPSPEARSS